MQLEEGEEGTVHNEERLLLVLKMFRCHGKPLFILTFLVGNCCCEHWLESSSFFDVGTWMSPMHLSALLMMLFMNLTHVHLVGYDGHH